MEVMRVQGTPASIEFILWLHRLLGQPYTAADLVELVTIVTLRDRSNNINGYGIRCDRITLAVWADEQNLALFAPGVPMNAARIRQLKPHYPKALEHLRYMGVLPSKDSKFIRVGR